MMDASSEGIIMASEEEQSILKKIETMLHNTDQALRLTGSGGEDFALPASLLHALNYELGRAQQDSNLRPTA